MMSKTTFKILPFFRFFSRKELKNLMNQSMSEGNYNKTIEYIEN